MFLDIVFLIVGLALILVGANALTDGSSAIAKRFGLSDLVVGLTVVAFGTSTPELVISVVSAVEGNAGLAIGNIVGSNIFNILAIIGITAIIRPLAVGKSVMHNQLPLVLLSSVVLLVMGNSQILDQSPTRMLTRIDGILLLLFFIIFMRVTFAEAKSARPDAESDASPQKAMPLWKAVVWTLGGLAMLVFGGDRFVDGASGLAREIGVSDSIIGLTIAAIGTSLPELATSVAAALKGKPGLAVGNVIGSNIFNIFLVLGTTATARPVGFGSIGNLDLLVLLGASFLFLAFGRFFGVRTITRAEGAVLTFFYVAYMAALVILETA